MPPPPTLALKPHQPHTARNAVAVNKLRRDAQFDDTARHLVQRIVRRDIGHYCASRAQNHDRALNVANRLLRLDVHNETVLQVADSCDRIGRLLEQLQNETKVDEIAELPDAQQAAAGAGGGYDENVEGMDEVQALRVFASDDTTLETSSVADYAADPPGAPLYSSTCVEECVNGMKASSNKAFKSVELLRHLVTENAQWWNSAIVLRRLKTHAIRANYHARRVKKWGDQCRSHLFVSNSILTRTAHDATKELREMREQMGVIKVRREGCEEKKRVIEAASVALQADVAALTAANEALDGQLRVRVAEMYGVEVADAQVCEAILLLGRIATAPEIQAVAIGLQKYLVETNFRLPTQPTAAQ